MQAAEQTDQNRAASAIVVERDLAFSIDRGQREGGSGITGTEKRGRHVPELPCLFESIQERQHHQRVGLEPGPLADCLRLLHELLGLRLVAQVEVDGGEAIVAGK